LRRRRRKASWARNFDSRKKAWFITKDPSCLSCKLLPCKIGSSSLCYIIRGVFQISFKAI
jgi:hypothetical protein